MARGRACVPGTEDNRLRRLAIDACNMAEEARSAGHCFCINNLPEPQRLAAHALLYAALAHVLGSPGRARKTLFWNGRRWHLSPLGRGSLEVSAYPGVPGLVSMPGALP